MRAIIVAQACVEGPTTGACVHRRRPAQNGAKQARARATRLTRTNPLRLAAEFLQELDGDVFAIWSRERILRDLDAQSEIRVALVTGLNFLDQWSVSPSIGLSLGFRCLFVQSQWREGGARPELGLDSSVPQTPPGFHSPGGCAV